MIIENLGLISITIEKLDPIFMLKTESETYTYLYIICIIFYTKMKELKGETT